MKPLVNIRKTLPHPKACVVLQSKIHQAKDNKLLHNDLRIIQLSVAVTASLRHSVTRLLVTFYNFSAPLTLNKKCSILDYK